MWSSRHSKCALKLLECLYSFEDLAHGNPSGITTAKNDARKNTIEKLDPVRMKYIQGKVDLFKHCNDVFQFHTNYRLCGKQMA